MHIGNQLYSSLSKLARQSFLLLTELPTMLTVLQENYQLEYSASYNGNVLRETTIEGYQYYMSLKRAFESLISEQYRSLILTVGCITVGIVYCADNRHFKVFDSHTRVIYGKSHPEGTCIPLDISSADNLVQYFQSLFGVTDVYDMRASNSVKYVLNTLSDQQNCFKNHHCFAIALCSMCCSIISPCGYWNSNTLDAII